MGVIMKYFAMLLCFALTLNAAPPIDTPELNPDWACVHLVTFNEGRGAMDWSDEPLCGIQTQTPTYVYDQEDGDCYEFTASSGDRISYADAPKFAWNGQFTLAMRVWVTQVYDPLRWYSQWQTPHSFIFGASAGEKLNMGTPTKNFTTPALTYLRSKWFDVIFTKRGTNCFFYINGTNVPGVGTTDAVFANVATKLVVAQVDNRTSTDVYNFSGRMSDVRIFKRFMTLEEAMEKHQQWVAK
jgi:hypothetical protein